MAEVTSTPTIPENAALDTNNTSTTRGRPTSTAPGADRAATETSRSPSVNRGLKDRMSGMMDKVRNAMSPHRNASGEHTRDQANPNAPVSAADEERGRSTHHHHGAGARDTSQSKIIATGRGGAGNMIRSKSPPSAVDRAIHSGHVLSIEEERAQSKERARSNDRPHPSGRGGAGNVRSPSRDPAAQAALEKLDEEERTVEAKYEEHLKEHPGPIAVGRGGAGNIS